VFKTSVLDRLPQNVGYEQFPLHYQPSVLVDTFLHKFKSLGLTTFLIYLLHGTTKKCDGRGSALFLVQRSVL
jgi:hypothetical protein